MDLLKRFYPIRHTVVFFAIALGLFISGAFPALYGDEYGSLAESDVLGANMHALGYFVQLKIWRFFIDADWFLRLLSLAWFAIGVFTLHRWLLSSNLPSGVADWALWLIVLNPFAWFYGFQVRFYAMFLVTSILFAWRFQVWRQAPSRQNLLFFLLACSLLLTSHLFGFLVLGIILLAYIWQALPVKGKAGLALLLVAGLILIFVPAVRNFLVAGVLQITNADASVAQMRGLNLAMLAKVPLSFYFFALGERVYPLWWWFSLPAMLAVGAAFLAGAWRMIRYPTILQTVSVFMLLSIPFMFLVLDPLAPPGLQGVAPRYLIFVLPYFLLVLAFGIQAWKPLKLAMVVINLIGLYCLAFPSWSYSGNDLIPWPQLFSGFLTDSKQTCVISDGRAQAPVNRYFPEAFGITHQKSLDDCADYPRIILVSNDYRVSMLASFDEMAAFLSETGYGLVSDTTFFPSQVTVYEQRAENLSGVIPSRLDLPEQDLRFPLELSGVSTQVHGFMRLTNGRPELKIPINISGKHLWITTNYRSEGKAVEAGQPIFAIRLYNAQGEQVKEFFLRAGMETSAWDGVCTSCKSMYEWTKQAHLLGTQSYPGAYRQYQAHIWGFSSPDLNIAFDSLSITFLLPDGTGYFYGIFEKPE